MNESPAPFAPAQALPPELLGAPEPPPPVRPRGATVLRTLGRIVLWSLITIGAVHGLVPATEADPDRATVAGDRPGRSATSAGDRQAEAATGAVDRRAGTDAAAGDRRGGAVVAGADRRAEAVAAAFLREYLTVDGDRVGRAERLRRFTAAGVDLDRSVSVPDGVTQYVDQVVVADARPSAAGTEVTLLAHVLQLRSGAYRDGGTLAFAVPLAVGRQGPAVSGVPRPIALPVASRLPLQRPPAAPQELVPAARRVAREAVVALVRNDAAALDRLGGGRPPSTRTLPPGWRAVAVGAAEVTGPPDALTALVQVSARPPAGDASYLIPVQVRLESSQDGLLVRHVGADGSARPPPSRPG